MDELTSTPTGAAGGAQAVKLPPADRLNGLFAATDGEIERKIAERRAAGSDVINLAVVEPALPSPPPVTQFLTEALAAPAMIRGAAGLPEFRSAVARWYQSRFKTSLDPNREILPLPSIEEGLLGLAQVLLNPGDVVLTPDPARPIYQTVIAVTGAQAVTLPLRPEQDFLPELKAVSPEVASKARLLWLDYPNLPTGAVAPAGFFHQVVQFAQENGVLVVHIADFSEYAYEGYRTISLLEIPGARHVCVEIHSPALTYSLPGWPGAVVSGNADVLRLLRQFRQQLHYLTFLPAQRALAETMMHVGGEWFSQRNAVYQARRDQAIATLEQVGLHVRRAKAVPSVWAGVPSGYTSMEVAEHLLSEAGVWVAPGNLFGARGEGYVQVSLTAEEGRFQEALQRLRGVTLPPRNVVPASEEEAADSAAAVGSERAGEEHPDAG